MMTTSSELAEFILESEFERIPDHIIQQTKNVLLDSIGCALAGLRTEKGRIALSFGKTQGAVPESTVFGLDQKTLAAVAAFVNGELLNALDYDVLCAPSGHVTPYVLSAPLAAAEWKHVSGKDLISAVALSHEIALRVSSGLVIPERLSKKKINGEMSVQLPIHGYGVHIFGGIAGVAKLLGLNSIEIENAFGIGAGMCPVPTLMQFAETVPSSMSKFSPSGWISQAAVTAVLLAQMGFTDGREVFDREIGFWKSFAADGWDSRVVTTGLGGFWFFSDAIGYKRYPCCGAMHGALDIFCAIIDAYDISPGEIKALNIGVSLLAEFALWKNRKIENHIDAQFSTAYVFAVAANRIEVGPAWQEKETYENPKIIEFMKKVNVFTPASPNYKKENPVVEVIVRKKGSQEDQCFTEKDIRPFRYLMEDGELHEKFKKNAAHVLSMKTSDQVLKAILALEEIEDVAGLMESFSSP